MSLIDRTLRLASEGNGLGLSCTLNGLSLAGVPLLQQTAEGLAPRPAGDLAQLFGAALGRQVDTAALVARLRVAARALDDRDISRAMIAALHLQIPELEWKAAGRLARTNQVLMKYAADQPRDSHGRWADENGQHGNGRPHASSDRRSRSSQVQQPPANMPGEDAALSDLNRFLSTFSRPQNPGNLDPIPTLRSLLPGLEAQFDSLGPKEFAIRASQFGYWLAKEGHKLNRQQTLAALAQYTFLQNRLVFWQNYENKPAVTNNYMIGAAYGLYVGAVTGGLISVGGQGGNPPKSMGPVYVAAMAYDGPSLLVRPRNVPAIPFADAPAPRAFGRLGPLRGLGGSVHNDDVHISWDNGIVRQGRPWETYVAKLWAKAKALTPGSKTFDLYDEQGQHAISIKTLNTLSVSYIRNPNDVYSKIRKYVDDVANYKPRSKAIDLAQDEIRAKSIYLAIPERANPAQLLRIEMARSYAGSKNIHLVVTQIVE
jgi:hypothetical protein